MNRRKNDENNKKDLYLAKRFPSPLVFLSLCLLSGCWPVSCFRKLSIESNGTLELSSKTRIVKKTKDSETLQIIRVLSQADSIFREAQWVVTGSRPPIEKSPFGKMKRAYLEKFGEPFLGHFSSSCDRYLIKALYQNNPQTKTRINSQLGNSPSQQVKGGDEIFETCSNTNKGASGFRGENLVSLGLWSFSGRQTIDIEYDPSHLQQIVGIASGIFGKKAHCRMKLNGQNDVAAMTCSEVSIDRDSKQLLRFTEFKYRRTGKVLMKLMVDVVEELQIVSKIVSEVPKDGPIKVVETELENPNKPKQSGGTLATDLVSPGDIKSNPQNKDKVSTQAPGAVTPASDLKAAKAGVNSKPGFEEDGNISKTQNEVNVPNENLGGPTPVDADVLQAIQNRREQVLQNQIDGNLDKPDVDKGNEANLGSPVENAADNGLSNGFNNSPNYSPNNGANMGTENGANEGSFGLGQGEATPNMQPDIQPEAPNRPPSVGESNLNSPNMVSPNVQQSQPEFIEIPEERRVMIYKRRSTKAIKSR